MLVQKVVDQKLGVDPLREERLGAGQLNRMRIHRRARVNREPENLNERKFGADAARGLDTVHFRHRDIHQDDVGPEHVRLSDRLEPVGGFAHDLKLWPRLQYLAEGLTQRRVIIDDQYPQRMRWRIRRGVTNRQRRRRLAQRGLRTDRTVGDVARCDQAKPRPAARRALDVEPATQQRQTLPDAEQSPSDLAGLRALLEFRRIEATALVSDRDAERFIRADREIDRDPVDLGVLDHVEEELPYRSEEQRADVLSIGIGARVGRDRDLESVLRPRPVRQPVQGG